MKKNARRSSMAALALMAAFVFGACSSSTATSQGGDDAGPGVMEALDASDVNAVVPMDAGPLWEKCDPSNVASCPSGLECFGGHTSPFDAYGLCVFSCAGASGPSCALSGGTCACPETPAGDAGDCSAGNAAGLVTVCVPAGDAGPSGDNQIDDAGAPAIVDASDAADAAG